MSLGYKSINLRNKVQSLDLILEKHTAIVLCAIFGISVLSKLWLVPRLGAVSFPNSDEHIFIELAKSFFYTHDFYSNGFNYIKQYNEVLFPLILSPAYWLFSPEHILTVFRTYGLLLISAALFPAYGLGKLVLGSKKQAYLVAILTVLIPEIVMAYTVGQEVVYFPLYILTLAFIYKKIRGDQVSPVLLGFMFFLLWICKAVGVTVFLAYIAYLGIEFAFIRKFENYKAFFLQLIILVVLAVGLKELLSLGIRYLNSGSFIPVSDFYNTAMTKFLKASPALLLSDIPNGVLYYLFYTLIACMVFPVVLVVDHFKQYASVDRKFLIFLGLCYLATLATVIVLVYMDEGGAARDVQRVHFRYFFPLLVPLMVMMLKINFTRVKLGAAGAMLLAFMLLYEVVFRPTFRSGSIIDSKSLLLLERIDSEIVHGFNIVFLLAAFGLFIFGYLLYKKLNSSQARYLSLSLLVLILFANQVYATYKTFSYYTALTSGIERKNEYVAMSHLIDSKPGSPVILYSFPTFWFDVLLSTQTNRDFSRADYSENTLEYRYEPAYPPNFIITPKDLLKRSPLRNASQVATELKMFDVFQVNTSQDGKIYLDYSLVNVHPDGWLKDTAKLLISGAGRGNEVTVSIGLSTNPNAAPMDAVFKDTTGNTTTIRIDPNGTTLSFKVRKNDGEKDFSVALGATGFFIPKELAGPAGGNDDTRKLTYKVKQVTIQ